MKHSLWLITLALLIAPPASAQDRTAAIDKVFSWVTPGMPGCSVAVSQNGTLVTTSAYGLADLERDVPITSDTVFDAASVVKQFVAAATLLLVEEGRLSLTEDVHRYLPELPDYGRTITLDHLMTHTSGIRDWTGLGPLTGRNVDALTVTLRQQHLDFAPGEEWAYSNGGYVLLKEIVARTSGMPFGEFARTRIFDPLGMKKTAYLAELRTIIKDRALAYEKRGTTWAMAIQVDDARGGGGALLSTPSDLVLWNEAVTASRLGPFVTKRLQEPARLNNGRVLGYGRGLFLDTNESGTVQWHSGGSAGYGTFLARFPEHNLSVATMCNAGDLATGGAYVRRIFQLFVPGARTAPPSSATGATGGASPDVTTRAGLYFSEVDGRPLRLAVEKNRLRLAGGPMLDALAADHFKAPRGSLSVLSQDVFELRFTSPDDVVLTSMEGRTTRYRRAQRPALTASDLQHFGGRYVNEENHVAFELTPGKDTLSARVSWNNAQALEFRPVDRDRFQAGGMFLRFRRDTAGAVIGLDYSNPAVRSVEFTRAGDCTTTR